MSVTQSVTAAARYDVFRRRARNYRLPPGYPLPKPTASWPPENVALLEQYRNWLLDGGASPFTTDLLYVPMAGHVLGLNCKPHGELNLDSDLQRGLDYVRAKRLSAEWIDMNRVALDKFRTFLCQERGLAPVSFDDPDCRQYHEGLPAWLVAELQHYQHLLQAHWRPARRNGQIRRFWTGHARLWKWLCTQYRVTCLADVKRSYVLAYIDHRLALGRAPSGINQDLRYFRAFLLFLQDRDHAVPQTLLRIRDLKQPDRLPRFLTDEQVRLLCQHFEQRVAQASSPVRLRDALLDRAAFYLLWQAGMRIGEVEELQLEDLDLSGRKLTVRRGKGLQDRTVFLTDTTVRALRDYLVMRGPGPTDHVFLYRNQPVHKDLLRCRIKYAGERVGVSVHPHRLRHTCATQLLNAGCRITSIQKLLGHRRLNSTMVYARVHDRTVAEDYYSAMSQVEQGLKFEPSEQKASHLLSQDERLRALELAEQLAADSLGATERLALVEQLRSVLSHRIPAIEIRSRHLQRGCEPIPSPALPP